MPVSCSPNILGLIHKWWTPGSKLTRSSSLICRISFICLNRWKTVYTDNCKFMKNLNIRPPHSKYRKNLYHSLLRTRMKSRRNNRNRVPRLQIKWVPTRYSREQAIMWALHIVYTWIAFRKKENRLIISLKLTPQDLPGNTKIVRNNTDFLPHFSYYLFYNNLYQFITQFVS